MPTLFCSSPAPALYCGDVSGGLEAAGFQSPGLAERRPAWRSIVHARLEGLGPRAQIDLLRPGASLLPVDEKGAVGDCFGPKEAIFAAFLEQMGEGTQQPVAVNAAVDAEMRDMDALRDRKSTRLNSSN